jgi:hypothetical protein
MITVWVSVNRHRAGGRQCVVQHAQQMRHKLTLMSMSLPPPSLSFFSMYSSS